MTECKSTIVLGDDYGDNDCTFHCQLEVGHGGMHVETGRIGLKKYSIVWSDGK